MSIDIKDARFTDIIHADTQTDVLSAEFVFTEGPIWHPHDKHLTFSDVPADRLYRWNEHLGIAVYRDPSNMTNGNTYDLQGRMLSCEHATSRVAREEDGEYKVLASHFDGKELNSPNDIVVRRRDGSIWFTDPTYGRSDTPPPGAVRLASKPRPQQLDFQGVYRIDPNGKLTLLAKDFTQPNGLCFDLEQTSLYVADTTQRHIRKFRIEDDGSLSGGDVFARSRAPDGLKIDSLGHVYTGGVGGVHVYHKDDGVLLGVIVSEGFCANFTWGGDDLCTFFMTASKQLLRTRVQIPGISLF